MSDVMTASYLCSQIVLICIDDEKHNCVVFVPGSEDSYLEAFGKNRFRTQPTHLPTPLKTCRQTSADGPLFFPPAPQRNSIKCFPSPYCKMFHVTQPLSP